MQTLETFLHHYGISHQELAKLLGKHKSLVTRALQGNRPGRSYMEAFVSVAGQGLEQLPVSACMPANFCSPAPGWLEQECIKAESMQLRFEELRRIVEKQQRQVRFWYYVSECACDFKCGDTWAKRHYEEKLYKLRRTWQTACLPLLLQLRQTQARIALLQGLNGQLLCNGLMLTG